jgi:phosphoribosylglycinamide formyltransferase-1
VTGTLTVVILISGRGTNLQAILDLATGGGLPIRIAAVISNRPGVAGLERARRAGVQALELDHTGFASRDKFDKALIEQIDAYEPDLLVLAGFMRILGRELVTHYGGRILNIHPSLLPRYPGLDTHRRALQAADREHGASVHFVTDALDGGPLVLQARVPVFPDDDEERLAARVLEKEHLIYPLVLRWYAQGRLRMEDDAALLDGEPLLEPRRLEDEVPLGVSTQERKP